MEPYDRIVQNCYVVRDLEEACAELNRLYGIGPFLGGQVVEGASHVHRGIKVPPLVARTAFAQSGGINIEVFEQVSTTPSAFRDMFAPGEEGFHHVAIFCENLAARRDAFVAAGYPVASEFTIYGEIPICCVDLRRRFGHMIELYPEHPAIRAMYREIREAAEDWDGRELIRPWRGS